MKFVHKVFTVVLVLGALVASVWFALQNKLPVPLDVLVYRFEPQSLAVWILLSFTLGGVVGMAVSTLILLRTRAALVSSRRQLNKARDELGKKQDEGALADAS
jgi:uncharacterized integral membrane protein